MRVATVVTLVFTGFLVGGCSIRTMAVDVIGDAMAEGGGTYARESDPDLVREALPFGLKTIEGLLETSPNHEGLLLSAASGFCGYAYLLKEESDRLDATDLDRARELRRRSSDLFLRGRDYALRALDSRHPGFSTALVEDVAKALEATTRQDAPLLYWAGAGWAGALSADKGNIDLLAGLPTAGALIERVVEVDEAYDAGSAHEFLGAYEAGRPGGSLDLAKAHFDRALALSEGRRASVYVGMAESIALVQQDVSAFNGFLEAALAVDIDAVPEWRLTNVLAQRRARWLSQQVPELFLDAAESEVGS